MHVQKKKVPNEGDKDLNLAANKRGGRKKKMKEPKVEDNNEDMMSCWTNAEATFIIHLQGKMIQEFNKDAKKQNWLLSIPLNYDIF